MLVVLLSAGCSATALELSGTSSSTAAPSSTAPAVALDARQVLERLPVKGRAPKTGYSREQFGAAWADVDGDRCDTRNQVLQAQLTNVRLEARSTCVVLEGDLADPYTGRTIHFVRAGSFDHSIDIDHLVPLGNAWQTGAQQLNEVQREALANDPLNLRATDPGANRQKGDSDAASWLPANKAYRCDYVAGQVVVKAKYGLWLTGAERDAVLRVLQSCPG